MTTRVLEVGGLSKAFGGVHAVDGVSFGVDAGEVVALIGPNGAGKTTTLLTLAGELPAISGEVVFRGAATKAPLFRRARQGMGFVTEERSVFMALTAEENLRVADVSRADAVDVFPELVALMDERSFGGRLSGRDHLSPIRARRRAFRSAPCTASPVVPIR